MSNWLQVLAGSLIGSVLALLGAIVLLSHRKTAAKMADLAAPFAAGALLGAAFFDLLPEALELADVNIVATFIVIGLITFFLLERFLHWFHHQHGKADSSKSHTAPLIITGDTVHNALDGVAIAAAFLVSPTSGFIASFAVAAHEVPQEVGDFGLLLKLGYSRIKTLLINILSAFSTTPVAILVFAVGGSESFPVAQLLGLTVGFFIYIAAADLIPRIHESAQRSFALAESSLLIIGVILIAIATNLAHNYIEADRSDVQPTQEVHESVDTEH